MTESLLTIGSFAKAVGLAPSALRYYDQAGLLRPAEVDLDTGYRYYTPELERRAHLLRRMRDIGVPIATMRQLLDEVSPERAADILQGFADQAEEKARATAAAVAEIISGLRAAEADSAPGVAEVDGPELASMMRRVARAAEGSTDSPLAVVLLDLDDASLSVVATDRYWLACWTTPVAAAATRGRRAAIPVESALELAEWLAARATVTVCLADDGVSVTDHDEEHLVSTVADRFPAYRLILESQPPATGRVTVDRERLLAAVPPEVANVELRAGGARLAVCPYGSREGVLLPAATWGRGIGLGFSARLLSTVLNTLVGSSVTVSYADAGTSVRLSCAEQRRLEVVAMPTPLSR